MNRKKIFMILGSSIIEGGGQVGKRSNIKTGTAVTAVTAPIVNASQISLCTRPNSAVKHRTPDHPVRRMKRIQHRLLYSVPRQSFFFQSTSYLDIQFPYFHKKLSDPIVVLPFMQ